MVDARIWIILALLKWPDNTVKFYLSHFPKSRGSFFKAKLQLMEIGIIENAAQRRGYLLLDPARAIDFMLTEYPGLNDVTELIDRHRDLLTDDEDIIIHAPERRVAAG